MYNINYMKKLFTLIGLMAFAVASSFAAPMRAAGEVNLIGNVYQSNDPALKGTMVRLPMRDGAPLEVVGRCPVDVIDATWGGFMRNGKYYAAFQWALSPTMAYSTVRIFNGETWNMEMTKICNDNTHNILASAVAYNEIEDKVYGAYLSIDGTTTKYVFATGDYDAANPVHTAIADIKGNPWSALAFDTDGTLYVITSKGEFGTVDKATGAVILKGNTGVTSSALSSAVIDKKTGRFFWTVNNENASGLYEIDKISGAATLVARFPNAGDFIGGLYVDEPLAADGAPDRVEDLSTSFTNGSLTGTVKFKMPSVLFDGTSASGEADWTILANGELVKTGKADYGADVETTVTVARADDWMFEVFASNDAGNSPRCSETLFVGNGTPLAPENVNLIYENGKMNLSWSAVDKVVDDKGFFNVSDLTYTVTRYPDGTVVSDGGNATSYSESIAEPEVRTTYYYTVKAVFRDNESTATESPIVVLGSLSAPWHSDFSDYTLGDLTPYDANGDGTTWSLMSDAAVLFNYGNFNGVPMDDWLFTPALKLIGGETYVFNVDEYFMPIFGSQAQNTFEIRMGASATPEGMTESLLEFTPASDTRTKTHRFVIKPEQTETVYFAVHVKCEQGNFFYVPSLSLSTGSIPAAVENLEIIPAPNGEFAATVKFTAPAVDIAGRPLPQISKIEVYRAETMLVQSFENPEPGKEYSFEDKQNFYGSGNYMWTVRVFNNQGEGLSANVVDYVGIPILCQQAPVNTVENGDTGEVTFSWTTVFKDNKGRDVNPDLVTINVLNRSDYLATGLPSSTTSYTFNATEPGEQKFINGMVSFVTQPGSTTSVGTLIAVGTPYTSYTESFLEIPEHETVSSEIREYGQWIPIQDGMTEFSSSDGDGHFYCLSGENANAGADLMFGKFDFRDMNRPTIAIDVLRTDAADTNTISVLVDDGAGYKIVKTYTVNELNCADFTWTTITTDLSEYKGKVVHLKIDGSLNYYGTMFIDRVRVLDMLDCNLTAGKLQGPDTAYPGIPVRLTAEVVNTGASEAKNITVDLLLDGETVDTKTIGSLAADATAAVTFEQTATLLSAEILLYSFEVSCAGDADAKDNTGATLTVNVALPDYPAVDDLSAVCPDGAAVELSWTEPAADAAGLSLMGFNIYRDNVKVNAEPVEDTRYTDHAAVGEHKYAVTAVYDKGESRGSNVVSANITVSGVSDIVVGGARISVEGKDIIVEGAGGKTVMLYNIYGTMLFKNKVPDIAMIKTPSAATYIIVVDGEASKIVVR